MANRTVPSNLLKMRTLPSANSSVMKQLIPRTSATSTTTATTPIKPPTRPLPNNSNSVEDSKKARCPTCGNERLKATLAKNNGICGNCAKKPPGQAGNSKSAKGLCSGTCGKEYNKTTLKKYEAEGKGYCKRCFDKRDTSSETSICIACHKQANANTLKMYNSICHPCLRVFSKNTADIIKLEQSQSIISNDETETNQDGDLEISQQDSEQFGDRGTEHNQEVDDQGPEHNQEVDDQGTEQGTEQNQEVDDQGTGDQEVTEVGQVSQVA